jgi:hypothetical protein
MLWFKHNRDLRDSPAMKQIQRRLGDAGSAAAYRLLEVMTARCGSGEQFSETLILASPNNRTWLAQEICRCQDDYGDPWVSDDHLEKFLDVFAESGFIQRGVIHAPAQTKDETGKWVDEPNADFETIRVLRFEELQDTWTARIQHAGRGQGKGGGGNASTK